MDSEIAEYKIRIQRYTLEELESARDWINKHKYPERYEALKNEIQERREGGDIITRGASRWKRLFPTHVPWGFAFRIWWSAFWRLAIYFFLISRLFQYLESFFSPVTPKKYFYYLYMFIFSVVTLALGIFALKQALGVRYKNFDLYVRKRNTTQHL